MRIKIIDNIYEYTQTNGEEILKVFLQPSRKFGVMNYFYCSASARDLVNAYAWSKESKTNPYIVYGYSDLQSSNKLQFHREVVLKDCIAYGVVDHINHVPFDNVDFNLNLTTYGLNSQNIFRKGYIYGKDGFSLSLKLKNKMIKRQVRTEREAIEYKSYLENKYFFNPYYYEYDRSQCLDILDKERTGEVSAIDAIRLHLERTNDNPWYYYRFNLKDWYKLFNWSIPSYSLDSEGFMVHHITGEKLCPV